MFAADRQRETLSDPRLELAIRQIEFARAYTLTLLDDIDDALWFESPGSCGTHIGWQVGHLAMAEYGLCLFRQRGRQAGDTELMNSRFRKQFSRGTTPNLDPLQNPRPEEIRDVFHGVHRQVLSELPGLPGGSLDEPVEQPYTAFPTKFGALLFSSHHELIHAGQIGLLRRLLGKQPVR